MNADLLSAFRSLKHPRILVLGDLILDRYTIGNAESISHESPVIVLRADQREARLGGAANVGNMLRGLEVRVTMAGVVGNDNSGLEMKALLATAGCDCRWVVTDPSRPTTVKERFVGRAAGRHANQILRVDYETRDLLPAEFEATLSLDIAQEITCFDLVVISDYGKGQCSPRLLRAVIDAAREAGIPVIVDPQRDSDWSKYKGVSLIKPNRLETEIAVGRKVHSHQDAIDAGTELCWRFNLETAAITLDRDGIALVHRNGQGKIFPIKPRPVYDVTGAGDMVIAMLGAALASGLSLAHAVCLANVAAGLEVERLGVAVIPKEDIHRELVTLGHAGERKIVTIDSAAATAEEHRRRGERIVFTNGCFDLLHVGHVTYLAQAKAMGDILIVGVNSDDGVRRLKGPTRPVIGAGERAAMLAALAAVDLVIVFDEDTPYRMLSAIRPDILVKGGTYAPHEVVGHELVAAYGGEVSVAAAVDGISTTKILASLRRKSMMDVPKLRRAA